MTTSFHNKMRRKNKTRLEKLMIKKGLAKTDNSVEVSNNQIEEAEIHIDFEENNNNNSQIN